MHACKKQYLDISYDMVLYVGMYYYMGYLLWQRNLWLLFGFGSNDFIGDRHNHV
jgi:hypothetical protein